MFLHRFQHRGLSLGGSSIDFVGQNNVREDRTFDEFKFTPAFGSFLKDICTGDVHRHQVGGELNTTEAKRHGLSQPTNQKCLGESRYAHQKRMPSGEKADCQLLDYCVLTNNNFRQFGLQLLVDVSQFVDRGDIIRVHFGDGFCGS